MLAVGLGNRNAFFRMQHKTKPESIGTVDDVYEVDNWHLHVNRRRIAGRWQEKVFSCWDIFSVKKLQ